MLTEATKFDHKMFKLKNAQRGSQEKLEWEEEENRKAKESQMWLIYSNDGNNYFHCRVAVEINRERVREHEK